MVLAMGKGGAMPGAYCRDLGYLDNTLISTVKRLEYGEEMIAHLSTQALLPC